MPGGTSRGQATDSPLVQTSSRARKPGRRTRPRPSCKQAEDLPSPRSQPEQALLHPWPGTRPRPAAEPVR